MNTEKMNQARAEVALSKLIRHNGVVTTKREFIRALVNEGYRPTVELVPELEFNRTKYNRMTNFRGEQDEYYRRCTEKTKKAYYMRLESSGYDISLAEYNFAASLLGESAGDIPEASAEQIAHLFGRK